MTKQTKNKKQTSFLQKSVRTFGPAGQQQRRDVGVACGCSPVQWGDLATGEGWKEFSKEP
jgi:hypothetical protein